MKISKTWQERIFYLILFLIPSNLGKHFILPSSYVSGILVDYLIPTIFLTDILILILIIPFLINHFKFSYLKHPLFIFLLLLLPSAVFSSSPIPAVFKWLKFLELALFSLWIKYNFSYKTLLSKLAPVIAASVIFQSILALAQWFKQSSVFSYLFLGEQPFSTSTPGIDKIIWFDGSLRIPPLATTPHPNILAGFLVISLAIIFQGRTLKKPLYFTSLVLGTITLFLTFSLSAWLAFLLLVLPLSLQGQNLKSKLAVYYLSLILLLSILKPQLPLLAPESSFTRRSQLAKIALQMFKDKPLFGVGLNNFTVKMDQYGYIPSTTRFLQPVHNIYLLLLSETGLIGLAGFLYLLLKGPTLRKRKTCLPLGGIGPCWILLFLGLFDHYPLTLQTGLLLFFLTYQSLSSTRQTT